MGFGIRFVSHLILSVLLYKADIIIADYLKTRLITNLLHKLNDYLKIVKQESPTKTNYSDLVVRVLSVLDHVLPHIFMSIINVADVMDKIDVELTVEISKLNNIFF